MHANTYSYRQVHFVWAHLEEYQSLEENPGEAGKDVRAALDHEFATLPEHTVCTCGDLYAKVPEQAGRGSGKTAGKAPSAVLMDMERGYQALPMFSQARTRLYLQKRGMSEIAIRNMHGREFEARHRRRIALESFQPGRPYQERVQDGWGEVLDPYGYMTDFLNLGELQFLARGSRRSRAA